MAKESLSYTPPDHESNRRFDRQWLDAEGARIISFAKNAVHPITGFAELDTQGHPRLDQPIKTLTTTRMTHVFSLAHLRGDPDAGRLVDHGLQALSGAMEDTDNGGWYAELTPKGEPPNDKKKTAYNHAFVILAASSATMAERPGANGLLDRALTVVEQRFWNEEEGGCRESWDQNWRQTEAYRGANSNMHMVEAFLAASDATGDKKWAHRALRIADTLINHAARENNWRLPEHYDGHWNPQLEYNANKKSDPFRPYGTTIGHWLEWSRLLLNTEAALSNNAPSWLVKDAKKLFDTSVQKGWAADGNEGFVYTLGWQDQPSSKARMHWVVAEGVGAAAALQKRTGEKQYEDWYQKLWTHADKYYLDKKDGSWHHELDSNNRPASSVWEGKNDAYHAFQATLIPQVPIAPSLASALRSSHAH
jgi:sulfoquinovose isomerase